MINIVILLPITMNYFKIYNNLIAKAQLRQLNKTKKILRLELESIETHHILPKSLGGTNNKNNLVILSAREHFLAHWLLRNVHRNMQMSRAFLFMATYKNHRINSKTFHLLKQEQLKDPAIYILNHIDSEKIIEGNRKQILSLTELTDTDLSEIILNKVQRRRWKLKSSEVKDRSKLLYDNKIYNFQNIETDKIFCGTWREFVKQHSIKPALFGQLLLGKIKHTSGWKLEGTILSNHSKSNSGSSIYSFIHKETGNKFTGLCKDFMKYANIGNSCCYELVNGKILQTKGWSLIPLLS